MDKDIILSALKDLIVLWKDDQIEGEKIADFIEDKILNNKGEIIFLTLYGSDLYGTKIKDKSDLDLKAIYKPDIKDVFTNDYVDSFEISTGKHNTKNSADDIDLQIWSIQKFGKLVTKSADINALDMLFAMSNYKKVIYHSYDWLNIYTNRKYLINNELKGMFGYIKKQVNKYAFKGSNLYTLNFISEYIEKSNILEDKDKIPRLKDIIYDIKKEYDKTVIEVFKDKSDKYLNKIVIYDHQLENGTVLKEVKINEQKIFHLNIRLKDFYMNITKWKNMYGNRVKDTVERGIDYKSFSHAFRSIYQILELFETGDLIFPLRDAEFLKEIKMKKYTPEELIEKLEDLMKTVVNTEGRKEFNQSVSQVWNNMKSLIRDIYRRL